MARSWQHAKCVGLLYFLICSERGKHGVWFQLTELTNRYNVSISLGVWLGLVFSHPISWVRNIFWLWLHLILFFLFTPVNNEHTRSWFAVSLWSPSACPSTGLEVWKTLQPVDEAGYNVIRTSLRFLWKLKFHLSPLCYLCTKLKIVTHSCLAAILTFLSFQEYPGTITIKYIMTVFLSIALISALIILHLIYWFKSIK